MATYLLNLKELRLNLEKYRKLVDEGHVFIVLKRGKPVFKMEPVKKELL